jgi:tetratricopeptide (TPR) repeat protein
MSIRLARWVGPRLAATAFVTVAVVACCALLRGDEVTLIPGTTFKNAQAIGGRVRGQVQSESPTEVVVTLGANTTRVPTDQIASIRYDGQTATFQLAESRESAGQLAEAAELFKKAAGETASRPFPQQTALFREAEALVELALVEPDRTKPARDKVTQFLRSYPASRHLAAAREALARLQLASGDFSGAEASIAELARLPRGGERAVVLRTKALARQGKHAEAIAELDGLIAGSPKGSDRQRAAMLAKAESLAGMKKFAEAETLVRQVIQANPAEDAAAQAPAYNTLGDCLRAANRPTEALIAYLHTDLLYSKDKEEHPRALHAIEALFRQLKQEARADEFAQRLKQEYPRSAWARASTGPR